MHIDQDGFSCRCCQGTNGSKQASVLGYKRMSFGVKVVSSNWKSNAGDFSTHWNSQNFSVFCLIIFASLYSLLIFLNPHVGWTEKPLIIALGPVSTACAGFLRP